MAKTIHILNGDGTAGGFLQSGLKGDTLIWREMLCEGPVTTQADFGEFWKNRASYFEGKAWEGSFDFYESKVLPEVKKLEDLSKYDEIVLWFEFDLFCQINLIFLLSHLYSIKQIDRSDIYLISPKDHPEVQNFLGMGQLSSSQLEKLYGNRVQLTAKELETGHISWRAYQSEDPMEILKLTKMDLGLLDSLAQALSLHMQRFPFKSNGLNRIEQTLLRSLRLQPLGTGELLRSFWSAEPGYGYGDLQILKALKYISPLLVNQNGRHTITNLGIRCLEGRVNLLNIFPVNRVIGGYYFHPESPIRFDDNKKRLVYI